MILKTLVEFWRRKTLKQRLAALPFEQLVQLEGEVKEKIDTWRSVFWLIQQEKLARSKQRKGA